MSWAIAAAIGKELVMGAKGEIENTIAAVIEAAKNTLPVEYQSAFFTNLQTRKASLYTGATKDLASSLWGDSNSGNDVVMTVTGSANAAKVPAHYRYKLRAAVFSIFGNSGRAKKEEKLAAENPPPSKNGVLSTTTGGIPTGAIIGLVGLAVLYAVMKGGKKK